MSASPRVLLMVTGGIGIAGSIQLNDGTVIETVGTFLGEPVLIEIDVLQVGKGL